MSQFVLAVDFDGTCVKFRYPKVGPDVPLAAAWLRRLVQAGAQLVLSTMRGDEHTHLPAAVAWFEKHELPLYGGEREPLTNYLDDVAQSLGQCDHRRLRDRLSAGP